MRRDVFQAIADPTRREIINIIANKSLNLNSLTEYFYISRPAISRHIKILSECGLINIKQFGRERICEARLDKLNEVFKWIGNHKKKSDERLDMLDLLFVDEPKRKKKQKKIRKSLKYAV